MPEFADYAHLALNNYEIRTEMLQGRKHIVVPVVMMVEGVHHGSAGPLFHPEEELSRAPHLWNGRPVTVPHPENNGQPASANTPDAIERYVVGTVLNAVFEDGKLKAEAWLDEERLRQYSPAALEHIRQARPLDVSVGVFTDDDQSPGEWNGEHYTAIARNHAPDHLALLPGNEGACSWSDGCGVRTNQGGEGEIEPKEIKALACKGYRVAASLKVNEEGFRDIMRQIQTKLDAMDDNVKIHFLIETFDDTFIYEVARMDNGESATFRRSYSVNEDGVIEFEGEPEQVVEKREFITVNQGGEEDMTTPCCKEKVEMVLQMDHLHFDEADRDYLLTLAEPRIDAYLAVPAPVVPQDDAAPAMSADMVTQEVDKSLKNMFKDMDSLLAVMPAEMREQTIAGIAIQNARKTNLITHIKANAPDVYTDEELAAMDMSALEKVGQIVKAPPADVDYSLNAAGGQLQTNTAEVGVLVPFAKKKDAA